MARRHFLQRKREPRAEHKTTSKPTVARLLNMLGDQGVDRLT